MDIESTSMPMSEKWLAKLDAGPEMPVFGSEMAEKYMSGAVSTEFKTMLEPLLLPLQLDGSEELELCNENWATEEQLGWCSPPSVDDWGVEQRGGD